VLISFWDALISKKYFLKLLQKEGQIKLIKTPSIVIIEITNYDIYQQKEGQKKDRTNKEEKQKMPNNNVNTDLNSRPSTIAGKLFC